ncbi:hypothetical protein EYD10_10390 [Varanus komodoensis]|nr:hypothetical protein EYD10_10390 [Varanus komodoensis]
MLITFFCTLLFTGTGQTFRKAKRESKEETSGEAKHCRKKGSHLLKKKISSLNFFSGCSRNGISQERNLLYEEKKTELRRTELKKLKTPREVVAHSVGKAHSGKMCPKCEIIVCRVCNMLHTESSFIAHSLLDHYDRGMHSSCCSESGLSQDHHVCKHNPGPSESPRLM